MEVVMSLIRRNNLFPAVQNLFDDFLTRDFAQLAMQNSLTNTTIPAVNIKETSENFEVEMAAPGMKKEDFKIQLENNQLTISSEKETEEEEREENRYTKKEFSYQAFQRTFQLPRDVVDVEKIEARYENGMLRLVIPKKEEAKQRPPRQIQVR
jgi:HSP20 family protein